MTHEVAQAVQSTPAVSANVAGRLGTLRRAKWLCLLVLTAIVLSWLLLQRPFRKEHAMSTYRAEVTQRSDDVSAGWGVIDILSATCGNVPRDAEKIVAENGLAPGGGALNFADAWQRAGGSIQPGFITGTDLLGDLLAQLVRPKFRCARRIATGSRTRLSIIQSNGRADGSPQTRTDRPTLDLSQTFAHFEQMLAGSGAKRLFLSSTTANESSLVERILDYGEAHSIEVFLMLTHSQCADWGTLDLARRCAGVACNAHELETWTSLGPPEGLYALQDRGVPALLVTAGTQGVYYIEQRGDHLHQPAYQIDDEAAASNGMTANGCGDEATAVFWLNRLVRGESIADSLRLAAAAGALRASGSPFADWAGLQSFADTAPLRPSDTAPSVALPRLASPADYDVPRRPVPAVLKRVALAVAAAAVGYLLSEMLRA